VTRRALKGLPESSQAWSVGACPVREFSMLSVFVPSEASLKKAVADDVTALPESAVWIDLVKPTAAEDKAVERLAGIAVPTREDNLSNEITFMLDAMLGVVNLQQNNIIKLFSVMAVVLMPPTLIASIYGMNFRSMPELEWAHGYSYALVAMLLAAAGPYLYFKWKKWL
jgi:Mg2+ and Co2+ transporter CorA